MNHINDTPAGNPIAWQTFGGGRVPGANDTTGHHQPRSRAAA
jgi:hypothetical protein